MTSVLTKWLVHALRFHKRTAILCLGWTLLLCLLSATQFGKSLDNQLIRALEFKARSYLNRSPAIDPRLKVYAFDDDTLKRFMSDDLDIQEWARLLHAMAEVKPRLIIIDKIFGTPRGLFQASEIIETLKTAKAPIFAAGFLSREKLSFREVLSSRDLSMELWGPDRQLHSNPEWLPVRQQFPYGPAESIEAGFAGIGHIHYDNDGLFQPFVRFSFSRVMAHISLQAADAVQVDPDSLLVNGHRLYPHEGRLAINFPDIAQMQTSIVSLNGAIQRARKGADFKPVISENQIVLILPAMYTGGSDTVSSPIGDIPGGYVHLAVINSILGNHWIRSFPDHPFLICASALVGFVCGIYLRSLWFFLMLTALVLLASLGGTAAFVYANCQLPWFWNCLSLLGTGCLSQVMRNSLIERRNHEIRKALNGIIPDKCVDQVVDRPELLNIEPSGQSVSIMFIDIVGFSITTQKLTPKESFGQLKDLLSNLTNIIHQHGGVVDKTLGDGLLCFFGYDITGAKVTQHADIAVQCAIAIQAHSYASILSAHEQQRAVFPLRIGINSASVFIGNIGNSNRFDFTMIGDGVNFASRLEGACDPFRIMIGAPTKAQLTYLASADPIMTKRFIRIKHHSELIEAWQIDPCHDQPHAIEKVEHIYWAFQKIRPREERFPILDPAAFQVKCDLGQFSLSDFSSAGFSLKGNVFLARTVSFEINLGSADGSLEILLAEARILPMTLEVCWGRKSGQQYRHGVKIVSLNKSQKELLFAQLQRLNKAASSKAAA